MPIKFRKVIRKVIGGEHKGEERVYAVAKANYVCDLTRLCDLISARTAMSSAEVKGIVDSFLWASKLELKAGATVRLGDLGVLYYVLRSEGVPIGEKFQASHIRGAKLVFRPGPSLMETTRNLHYEADVPVKEVIEEECRRPHAG